MKKIIFSLAIILAVSGVVIGITTAYFSDTETSTGNIFTAGELDLQVDHTYAMYNGEACVSQCEPTGEELIVNGGFEEPQLAYHHWQVFPDASQTHWTVENGAGLEIQNGGVAGDPHSGNQLAELDSHGQDSSSTISQTINTVPGQEYRLVFYYSPRPHRPAGDNTLGLELEVIAGSDGPIFTDTIMENAVGDSNTVWTEYTYNFKAVSSLTTIKFSDEGTENTLGGYLDDISIKALDCSYTSYGDGGNCVLWNTRDLGQGDTFWNFTDVKPGDYGVNVISLHLSDNPGWICMDIANTQDLENNCNEPETEAGDTTCQADEGELSQYLEIFTWADENNDGVYNPSTEYAFTASPVSFADYVGSGYDSTNSSAINPGGLDYIGMAWCAGTMTVESNGDFTCDPIGMNNLTQTDGLTADIILRTVQARHNEDFICSQNNGGGSFTNCDDGNLCTNDYYDTNTHECANTPVNCDDGDSSTADSCDVATGHCINTPISCDDGDLCTNDYYDSAYNSCQHSPVNCDDGILVTIDSCDSTIGCQHTPISCTNGSDCPQGSGCNTTQGFCE